MLVTRLEPKGWEEPRTVQEAVGKKGEEMEGEVKVREGEGFKLYVMTLGVLSYVSPLVSPSLLCPNSVYSRRR